DLRSEEVSIWTNEPCRQYAVGSSRLDAPQARASWFNQTSANPNAGAGLAYEDWMAPAPSAVQLAQNLLPGTPLNRPHRGRISPLRARHVPDPRSQADGRETGVRPVSVSRHAYLDQDPRHDHAGQRRSVVSGDREEDRLRDDVREGST